MTWPQTYIPTLESGINVAHWIIVAPILMIQNSVILCIKSHKFKKYISQDWMNIKLSLRTKVKKLINFGTLESKHIFHSSTPDLKSLTVWISKKHFAMSYIPRNHLNDIPCTLQNICWHALAVSNTQYTFRYIELLYTEITFVIGFPTFKSGYTLLLFEGKMLNIVFSLRIWGWNSLIWIFQWKIACCR